MEPKVIKYGPESLDEDFRKHVIELFNSAEGEVIIITGEGSAFGYQDVRWAVKDATERGVKYKVYATNPLFVSKWLAYGSDIYKGTDKVEDHYLVVDGKSFIHSYPHSRREVGVREGEVHLNDTKGAREIIGRFAEMVSKAEKVSTGVDPLKRMLENPSDWGVETDSSKIDEVIYG